MSTFIRLFGFVLVRLFYRRIRIVHQERLPTDGGVIVVANHPNALLDPVIVNIALRRRVAFLAKSTFFTSWIGRRTMDAFSAIPVYRAKEADTKGNDKTFALCRVHLQAGGWLALFPEGVSHSEPQLQPLKTGAARIALQAGSRLIVPVGLTYDAKDVFRSRVTATVGTPVAFTDGDDARALTDRIAAALASVVLEADDLALWQGFRFAARWIARDSGGDVEELARRLARAYQALLTTDPALAQALVDDVRAFDRLLASAGIAEPFELSAQPRVRSFFLTAVGAALAFPIAVIGVVLAYLPYRAVKPIAEHVARGEQDIVSTVKALLGALVLTVTYGAWATLAGLLGGWRAATAMAMVGPLSGYVALRFSEWMIRRSRLLGAAWKRVDIARIERARSALAKRLSAALS